MFIFGTADDKLDNNWRKLWILEARRKLKTNTRNVKSFRFDSISHRMEFICWWKCRLNYILRHGLSMFTIKTWRFVFQRRHTGDWIFWSFFFEFSFKSPKSISCHNSTAYKGENNWTNCLMIWRIICVDENYIYVIISPYVTIGH